ncbi:pilus assembly protein PilP [Pseudomonas sp. LD120]|uniref:pilus assembly protein PilP n=1 Tax=Pseudomonas sp. LD120 TaxID=485751 RepID=UPI00135A1577|nr:pilus assembly protein PilP [Pseudomonas sp. LD120]KAF0862482.1 pilus assembly protein PilP [Pseudomonas sp. LD120]
MRRLPWVLPGCFCLGLWGCDGGEGFADLDGFMNEMRLQSPGPTESIAVQRSHPALTYNASALRSPFQPPQRSHLMTRRQGALRPDPDRIRQYLEGFDIEQLQMVGTLSSAAGRFALLRGAGGVHRLKVGDYLGRNEGRVVAISESRVDLVEVLPDGAGAWVERPRTLPLKKHS